MPDTSSIVIGKSFTYRGAAEVWTNKYHFEGDTPTTNAAWIALGVAIWNSERAALGSNVGLASIIGYQAGNEAAKYMGIPGSAGFPTTGLVGTQSSAASVQGDVSLWVRWSTPDRNSKNKPIYLRKYFHGVPEGTQGDVPFAAARTALAAHGAKMIDGTLPGSARVCGPQGADASDPQVAQYFTTRTLKRNARTPI